jgi:hypothetical protein
VGRHVIMLRPEHPLAGSVPAIPSARASRTYGRAVHGIGPARVASVTKRAVRPGARCTVA